METAASDIRRRARDHALRGGPPAELAHGFAKSRQLLVVALQVAVVGLLAARGFSPIRILVHLGICLVYVAACRYPASRITIQDKIRVLVAALLSYGGWLANTGGIASPLIPLGVGLLSPALLILDGRRQKGCFIAGAAALLLGLAVLSSTSVGGLASPLAPHDGRASLEYVLIAISATVVTAHLLTAFWARVTAAYDQVAIELGTRREELCSEGEDRTRELEGAAAHLAHEIKNPLASIKCLSAHMAQGGLDPKTTARLAVVAAEADRLAEIVDSFFLVSCGLNDLSLTATRPYELARELRLLLEVRANEASVSLEVIGETDLVVEADTKKVRRVLFQLMMNAVQASSAGQTVTTEVGSSPGGDVHVKVIDRGEGMSEEVLRRIERPYFTTREGGTGLGVAVARSLVEQHGGRLEYESAPGRGTTAKVVLPRRPPATRAPVLNPSLSGGR
jgi:two-component system, NtrC family, sensor histidine kinase HydH